jgi:hypothetical protein
MTLAEKLSEVGNNRPKLYKKGALDYSPQETVSGEAIGITDISPIEHNMAVKVKGKNILKYPYYYSTKTLSGITYTDNGDGSITVNGTATAFTLFEITQMSKNDCSDLFVDGATYTISKTPVGVLMVVGARDISTNKAVYYNSGTTFTVNKSAYKYEWIRFQLNEGTTVNNATVYPMIEEGTTATSFAPYIEDISTVKLLKQGKNLFNADLNTLSTITYITTSGTQSTRTGWEVELQAGVTYTVNAIPKNGDFTESYLYGCVTNSTDNLQISTSLVANKTVKSYTFTAEKGWKWKVYDGLAANPLSYTKKMMEQFYIQLEVGTTPTEYEPYIEPTVYDVPTDGTVEGVKSLYPSTTLYTDTQGAVIDCTYYQDGKKVKENLTNKVSSIESVTEEVTE